LYANLAGFENPEIWRRGSRPSVARSCSDARPRQAGGRSEIFDHRDGPSSSWAVLLLCSRVHLYATPQHVATYLRPQGGAIGRFRPRRSGVMHDTGFGLRRINLPRTPLNKPRCPKIVLARLYPAAGCHSHPSRCPARIPGWVTPHTVTLTDRRADRVVRGGGW